MIAGSAGGLEGWVPGLRTLREYRRSWLASDLVAGLVLSSLAAVIAAVILPLGGDDPGPRSLWPSG